MSTEMTFPAGEPKGETFGRKMHTFFSVYSEMLATCIEHTSHTYNKS